MKILRFFFLTLFWVFAVSCENGGNSTSTGTPEEKGGHVSDSLKADNLPEKGNDKVIHPSEIGEIESEGVPKTFSERVSSSEKQFFGENYDLIGMDLLDKLPIFESATQSHYQKFRKKEPISNEYGKSIFPRPVFKAWEFRTRAELEKALTIWLNTMESSASPLELRQDVKAVKSPPFLCAATETELFILLSACVYQGAEWDRVRTAFKDYFSGEKVSLGFEVGCNAGELKYFKK